MRRCTVALAMFMIAGLGFASSSAFAQSSEAGSAESQETEEDESSKISLLPHEDIGAVKGWRVGYSSAVGYEESHQGCIATGRYQSGSVLTLVRDSDGNWWFAVSNENWKSLANNNVEGVTFRIGRTNWQGEIFGAVSDLGNSLVIRPVVEGFVRDFARSSSLQVLFQGKVIDQFSLVGTQAARDAVDDCYRKRLLKEDPFASAAGNAKDPFAGKASSVQAVGRPSSEPPSAENSPPPLRSGSAVPVVIISVKSLFLRERPTQKITIGETLSLAELGRRLPSCRVASEYVQGDDDGVETKITCQDASISIEFDESSKIIGFETNSPAVSVDGIFVGNPVTKAVGTTAYCNLCTEDQPPFCKIKEDSAKTYPITHPEGGEPKLVTGAEGCSGTFSVLDSVTVSEIWVQ